MSELLWKMFNKLGEIPCFLGAHSMVYTGQFSRRCSCCDAEFAADYFDWRDTGHATWVRLKKDSEK